MPESKTNIISIFASVFIAIIILIAAYIFGWQPAAVEDQAPPASEVQPATTN